MHRSRLLAPLAALAASLAIGPVLSTVVLAADPTVTVKRGDTLTGIAKRHGLDLASIVALNQLPDPNRIYPGQQLRIGIDPATATAVMAVAVTAAPAEARVHVVSRGENLTRIAAHYGVTVAAIVQANGIANPSRIIGGQQLIIPGVTAAPAAPPAAPAAATPAAAPAEARVHVVARGENLTSIAAHYGVTVAAVVQANGITNPSRIIGGQQLVIPGADAAPAAAPAAAMPGSMAALVAQRDAVRQVIVEEANQYGVPVALALAVAWQESGWRQGVVSSAGAVGVMQLMPATAEWVGGAMLGYRIDSNDTRLNVRGGVRLLAHYLARYSGDIDLVLAAYYQGQSAVDRHGIYTVSRPYIASIRSLQRLFGG